MTNEINVNNLSEMINDKADIDLSNISLNIDYVVEWKSPTSSDPSWYRIYKSGWIEQGGKASIPNTNGWTTVTLYKEMIDSSYFISNSLFSDDAYWSNQQPMYVSQRTSTSFLCRCNQNTSFVMWEVKGYMKIS